MAKISQGASAIVAATKMPWAEAKVENEEKDAGWFFRDLILILTMLAGIGFV